MYGYAYPRRPELAAIRVRVSESQLQEYRRLFPALSRARILDTMIAKGPLRETVESELRRMSREAVPAHP
ncbi:MAG TPA: hypothetical protein VFE23_17190 [Usitatibacter sp.]|jgi:hypothetical protein|nr:hypothetical protein [Usitatibacter sp.]